MRIFDISQEVFSCNVYPGDPAPEKEPLLRIADGAVCNLTAFRMCAHNGTHVDAPWHFLDGGKAIDRVALDSFIGRAYVAEHSGPVTAADAEEILAKARNADEEAAERLLVKGPAVLTEEGAAVLANSGIRLFGNESQTVGPEDAPMKVHQILLGAETVLLEGVNLSEVPEGVYLLNAAPLNLGGLEGAPCRAVLLEM